MLILILIFNKNTSDAILFIFVIGIVVATCIFGCMKFYKQYKSPEKYVVNVNTNNTKPDFNKLYDAEYNWDIAIKNYCNQQNKTVDKLNDTDKEIIWKYCYSEINFLVMWLLENDFFVADKSIQETANLVKTRKATPDLLMNTIDGKLMADDLKEEIVDFVRNYLEEDETIQVEYSKLVENKTKKQVKGYEEFYSFVFKWDDYEYFKPYIVDSYKRYKNI